MSYDQKSKNHRKELTEIKLMLHLNNKPQWHNKKNTAKRHVGFFQSL